ncbi:MAG: hypothetical protein UIM53_06045 [Acutalibacteraceae bacterium]|nr:hypothetical protein [Acutalibacteraceae bacterium]
MPKHITKELKENIVREYLLKPQTIHEVAQKYKVSDPSVIKILDENNIIRYSKAKLFSPKLDEDFFENIDSEEKAYFLGLIITDGCIHEDKKRETSVSITLIDEDSYLLEYFRDIIGSEKKVAHDGRGCSQITIYSNKMAKDLEKYGIVPRKSLSTIFPQNIDNKDMYRHILRGIFDGDGSIGFYKRKNRISHDKKN